MLDEEVSEVRLDFSAFSPTFSVLIAAAFSFSFLFSVFSYGFLAYSFVDSGFLLSTLAVFSSVFFVYFWVSSLCASVTFP